MKTKNIFYTGQNIQQSHHLTGEASLFDLYLSIAEPSKELIQSIHRLIDVKSMGPEAYRKLKTRLPYFIGAEFKDQIRRAQNFLAVHYFVIDLDHCILNLGDEDRLKDQLKEDQRIALMFTSPGSEGLKVVFSLKTPITDTQVFSQFYTAFAQEFAKHYQLENFVDFTTKDASRVCFLSVDPKAYINEDYVEVDAEKYVSIYHLSQKEGQETSDDNSQELNQDTYADILTKLNPKTPKRKKDYYVPEAITSIFSVLKYKALKMGIPIVDHKDISYGKQISFERNQVKAIINLYHGKRGFSVVATNKHQSNDAFAQVCVRFIESVIYQPLVEDIPYMMPINPHAPTGRRIFIILSKKLNSFFFFFISSYF